MSKQQFFNTQEEYLNFRNAWSQTVNSKEAKPTYEPCYEYRYDVPKGSLDENWVQQSSYCWRSKEKTGSNKRPGCMEASHHMLYNILRNKPIHNGFTPITNKNKLNPFISDYDPLMQCLRKTIWTLSC